MNHLFQVTRRQIIFGNVRSTTAWTDSLRLAIDSNRAVSVIPGKG